MLRSLTIFFMAFMLSTSCYANKVGNLEVEKHLVVVGDSKLGDGGTTDYTEFTVTGDQIFNGSAGLPYGIIAGDDQTVTCTTENTWYQITFDAVGDENLITGSTANNEMVIGKTGTYDLDIHVSLHSANSQDWEVKFCKNNCATDLFHAHLFITTAVAARVVGSSVRTVDELTAGDTLEAWVRCTSADTEDIIFDHVSILAVMVGG